MRLPSPETRTQQAVCLAVSRSRRSSERLAVCLAGSHQVACLALGLARHVAVSQETADLQPRSLARCTSSETRSLSRRLARARSPTHQQSVSRLAVLLSRKSSQEFGETRSLRRSLAQAPRSRSLAGAPRRLAACLVVLALGSQKIAFSQARRLPLARAGARGVYSQEPAVSQAAGRLSRSHEGACVLAGLAVWRAPARPASAARCETARLRDRLRVSELLRDYKTLSRLTTARG